MESPRKTLVVRKGNKYEADQEAGRSPNMETPKRSNCLVLKGKCESDQEMGRNLTVENPRRSPAAATKHFMAPTISAVSKASPARKKVLGERNDATETQLVKTPLPRSRSFSRDRFGANENTDSLVDGISAKGRLSMDNSTPRPKFLRYNPERRKEVLRRRENDAKECKKDDSLNSLESGYASDDYDPVRNYLSPRPKFLWYDPNRSRERVLRRETEAKEPSDYDNATDLGDSSSSLSSQDSMKERDEVEESDGEVKEVDESGGEGKEVNESDREVMEVDGSNKECKEVDGSNKEVKEVDESEKENKAEEGNMDVTNCLEAHDENAVEVDLVDSESVMCEESDTGEVSEEVDESDWELEEDEVKKGWRLRGVLKFMLLLFVLSFSSSVILNTNTPPASLGLEGIVNREQGQITFTEKDQMPLIRLLSLEVPGMSFIDVEGGQDMEEEEMHSEGNETLDAAEDEISMGLIGRESEEVKPYVEQEEGRKKLGGLLEVWNGESLNLGGLIVAETCHVSASDLHENKGVESQQLSQADAVGADEEVQLAGATDGLESRANIYEEAAKEAAVEETPELLAVAHQEIELPAPTYGPESADVLLDPIKEHIVDPKVVERIENPSVVNANPEIPSRVDEVEVLEVPFRIDVVAGHEMQLEGAADHMESENANLDELNEDETVNAELGRIRNTIIGGISALSLAVGSLVWALRVKSKRTASKETFQVEEPAVENKKNLEHAVPAFAATKTPFDLIEKYSRAPSVELLSEFAVGEMSSIRTCRMKSRIFETEEVSSHSMPFGKATTRKAYSVPVQPAISAISSTENRSVTNGEESSEVESSKKKFTTPRRTSRVRSEDEGSEVLSMNTAETPTLRRSSRLRSRGVVSP